MMKRLSDRQIDIKSIQRVLVRGNNASEWEERTTDIFNS